MMLKNRLAEARRACGVSAAELAARCGVHRQTIYAIEAGSYMPNTALALKMALELRANVNDLFTLEADPLMVEPEILSSTAVTPGAAVRIGRVGSAWIGVPSAATPYFLADADGVIGARGEIELSMVRPPDDRPVIAGCDPALGLLLAHARVDAIAAPAASRLALEWLRAGKVHIAGAHLEDRATGEFNLPYLRRELAGEDLEVVTFAEWEEGFVVAAGNPKRIRSAGDLAREGVTLINRELGSGSRGLLDRLLDETGVDGGMVEGYDAIAAGHLAAAEAVRAGRADCCVATGSAARAFGLGFVPLKRERFDLVIRRDAMDQEGVKKLLDALSAGVLRKKLQAVAGYDVGRTGSRVS